MIEEETRGGDDASQPAATGGREGEVDNITHIQEVHPPADYSTEDGKHTAKQKVPEVGAVNEEQAQHHTVQQEHAGHVEVSWVAQA